MTYNHKDRRGAQRVQVSLQLHLVYDDMDQLVEHYSHNISEEGIFIETEEPLQVGTHVRLKISLVHQELMCIDAMGEVIHAQKTGAPYGRSGMGVRFVRISMEGQHFIRDFVVSRLKEKAIPRADGAAKAALPLRGAKKRSVPKKKKKVGKTK